MARRLATEYVNICLRLSEKQLRNLQHLQKMFGCDFHDVTVLSNGHNEVRLSDKVSGESLVLDFERGEDGYWVHRATCYTKSQKLAEMMRQFIRHFKGDAISHRIYINFTMVYYYAQGKVAKIIELSELGRSVVYEKKQLRSLLQQLYQRQDVEAMIREVKRTIDQLLDERNNVKIATKQRAIDEQLSRAARQLFYLEA